MAGTAHRAVQFVPADAELHVRREASLLTPLLRDWGWESLIRLESDKSSSLRKTDFAIVHFTGAPVAGELHSHPGENLVLVLHDYVPPENHRFYEGVSRAALEQAERDLRTLAEHAEVCIAHCGKAERILEQYGARRVRVVPLLFDFDSKTGADDAFTAAEYVSGPRRWLFAGEVDAESGIENALKSFWYFRRFVRQNNEDWQLLALGRQDRCDGAFLPVQLAIKHYEIPQPWFSMAGAVEDEVLHTHFRHADLYISLDRGDLDGAGLLRAVACGCPVLSVADGAGEMVLGDAPLLLVDPTHSVVAEEADRVLGDKRWRSNVLERQRGRLVQFQPRAVAFALRSIFSRFRAVRMTR